MPTSRPPPVSTEPAPAGSQPGGRVYRAPRIQAELAEQGLAVSVPSGSTEPAPAGSQPGGKVYRVPRIQAELAEQGLAVSVPNGWPGGCAKPAWPA